ncbi:integral membrane protein [Mycobacterium tuberculosis]|nr:integral membrane protein [Mycobacterium tuberculosis]CKL77017.1 integral membrane protein [Mycobacterium tuberculosis]CKL78605.1 integral membrane protein [Mycobacterium tuberculosis]CKL84304.1 integral membrane protein [Mycobacterium tuberculosis]CKP23607.1 integral membrane protein [Mycobacterium tuberculosis]
MFTIVGVIVALIGAFVQSRRHRHRPAADIHMLWWMVLIVGVVSIIGAGYHVFDGERTAELIGYTRGDGGFQWENAMGDLAIGVVGLMAYRFRGHFWLATIVVLTIQYVGDAAGHIYYWVVENNTNHTTSASRCGPTSCYPSSCGRSMRGRGTATATRCRKVSLSHRARRRSPARCRPAYGPATR